MIKELACNSVRMLVSLAVAEKMMKDNMDTSNELNTITQMLIDEFTSIENVDEIESDKLLEAIRSRLDIEVRVSNIGKEITRVFGDEV